jgi:ATP-dependent Clp protease adaptor protein ClpS
MMEVHTRGRGVCGAYTLEVAETKVQAVHDSARAEGYPLRAGIEEA